MKVLLFFETYLLAEGIKKLMRQLAPCMQFELLQPGPSTRQRVMVPDFELLLIDAESSHVDPLEVLQLVKKTAPLAKVIFAYEKPQSTILKAYRKGLNGAFSKKDNTADILSALGAVIDGKVHVPQPIIVNILCDGFVFTDLDNRLNQLTKREISVLEQIAQGKSMKESARTLALAPSTLSAHKQRIMKKLELRSLQEFNNFIRAFGQQLRSPTGLGEAFK